MIITAHRAIKLIQEGKAFITGEAHHDLKGPLWIVTHTDEYAATDHVVQDNCTPKEIEQLEQRPEVIHGD